MMIWRRGDHLRAIVFLKDIRIPNQLLDDELPIHGRGEAPVIYFGRIPLYESATR